MVHLDAFCPGAFVSRGRHAVMQLACISSQPSSRRKRTKPIHFLNTVSSSSLPSSKTTFSAPTITNKILATSVADRLIHW